MISKSPVTVRFAAVAFSAIAFVGFAQAQDPNIVQKLHVYAQTSSATPVDYPLVPFAAKVAAPAAGVTLHFPSGATLAIPYDSNDQAYQVGSFFASKAALDAAYPNGTYTMTATGLPTATLNLTTDNYPTVVPQVTGGTFSAGGVYIIDPTQAVTINFNNFTTYATAGVAGHESFHLDTNNNSFQKEIATQAVFGLTQSSTPFTSVTIPANTLTGAGVFEARIQFDTLTTLDASGSGSVALYAGSTQFWVAALPPGNTALPLPIITTQPGNRTAALGGSATITAGVNLGGNGSQNIQYRWYLDGRELPIFNATKYSIGVAGLNFTLVVNSITAADFGSYTLKVITTGGIVTTNGATLTQVTPTVPTITTQPVGHNMATGSTVVFNVTATGSLLSFQWKKDGVILAGRVGPSLLLSNVQPSDIGSYTVTVTNTAGSVTSNGANLSVAASSDPGRLVNASVRIVSGTGANVLIVGFVTGGAGTSGSKQLLIRGIGPTLTGFGVPGAMVDPILDIIPGGQSLPTISNDNWAGDSTLTAKFTQVGAFALPDTTSKDSALLATLASGVYSAKVSGVGSTTGTVLAEIYDGNPSPYVPTTPRLVNLSARVSSSNGNPLITGFVIGGTTARTLMVRAIGPTLTTYGVPGAMADPQLELYQSVAGVNTLLMTNDNWGGSSLATSVDTTVGAFAPSDPTSKDAIIIMTLDPGVYSAKVLSADASSGIALAELYEVP